MPTTSIEKLAKANQLKEEGNLLFKAEQWKRAAKKYHHSLMYSRALLDTIPANNPLANILMSKKEECEVTPEQKDDATKLMIALSNNLAGLYTVFKHVLHAP